MVHKELDPIIHALPSATGATVSSPQFDGPAVKSLTQAQKLATELGDEYVSTEHLLVGLATDGGQVADLLKRHGATPDALREAFAKVRGLRGSPARTRRARSRRWRSTAST